MKNLICSAGVVIMMLFTQFVVHSMERDIALETAFSHEDVGNLELLDVTNYIYYFDDLFKVHDFARIAPVIGENCLTKEQMRSLLEEKHINLNDDAVNWRILLVLVDANRPLAELVYRFASIARVSNETISFIATHLDQLTQNGSLEAACYPDGSKVVNIILKAVKTAMENNELQ